MRVAITKSSIHRNRLLLLVIFVSVLVLVAIPAGVLSYYHRQFVIEVFQRNALNISQTVADVIEQEIEPYRELVEIEDYEETWYSHSYYWKMNTLLRNITRETQADYIYTLKQVGEAGTAYILDGTNPNSDDFFPIGMGGEIEDTAALAIRTVEPKVSGLSQYEDWGKYLTAYTPIVDETDGRVLGLVCVDFSEETL